MIGSHTATGEAGISFFLGGHAPSQKLMVLLLIEEEEERSVRACLRCLSVIGLFAALCDLGHRIIIL